MIFCNNNAPSGSKYCQFESNRIFKFYETLPSGPLLRKLMVGVMGFFITLFTHGGLGVLYVIYTKFDKDDISSRVCINVFLLFD